MDGVRKVHAWMKNCEIYNKAMILGDNAILKPAAVWNREGIGKHRNTQVEEQ